MRYCFIFWHQKNYKKKICNSLFWSFLYCVLAFLMWHFWSGMLVELDSLLELSKEKTLTHSLIGLHVECICIVWFNSHAQFSNAVVYFSLNNLQSYLTSPQASDFKPQAPHSRSASCHCWLLFWLAVAHCLRNACLSRLETLSNL